MIVFSTCHLENVQNFPAFQLKGRQPIRPGTVGPLDRQFGSKIWRVLSLLEVTVLYDYPLVAHIDEL